MNISKAIKDVMKKKGFNAVQMARMTTAKNNMAVTRKLRNPNLTFNSAVEYLNALGYEIVIQEKKPGKRRPDQIVIDQLDE